MRWVLGLVGTGIDGPSISVNIMEFDRRDCLEDITSLGLTLAEGKQLLALVQQEIVAAQVGNHAVLRPGIILQSSSAAGTGLRGRPGLRGA